MTREAYEAASLRSDRVRIRALHGLHETARGESLAQLVADITELAGDSRETEDVFSVRLAAGDVALVSGDPDAAFHSAMQAFELKAQNPDVPLTLAMRAAIWSRNLDRVRQVAALQINLPGTGAFAEAERTYARAAVAALEGRSADAVAGLRDANAALRRLGQRFEAARHVVDAAVLLPDEPEVLGWVDEARALFTELRAQPYLDRLDQALASSSSTSPAPATSEAARARA